jgi:hypothetical protein
MSLLGSSSIVARAAQWTVIFRSSDPKLWNTDAGDSSKADGFATALDSAPQNVRYLKLERMDNGETVIVSIARKQLRKSDNLDDDLIWFGGASIRGPAGNRNRLLGLARKSWATSDAQDHLVARAPGKLNVGYRGWGFSKAASGDPTQTYSWAGSPISKTVFEISVTGDDLAFDEQPLLLNTKPTSPSDNNPKSSDDSSPTPPPEAAEVGLAGAGPTTRISKLQTSIEALYVIEQPAGGMLGLASRFILTATPGVAKDNNVVPVSFATPVGHEMGMVLDDVARALDVHYRLGGVEKIELSFEDKYTAKDGGSIGAAIGTLMLSMIQGFDIDPTVAITGDVTADAKVGRIGGVAAKLRGAADAGCTIVAVPSENYDQVKDAMVYEGTGIVMKVQVIGISTLDEAAAVCRSDRDAKLAHAINLFSQIQKSVKESPDYLYRTEALEKLRQVVALAPNHFSAKLLMLASQHKLPRLSAAASKYYTFVAVSEYWNTPALNQTSSQVSDYSADIALTKLRKLRPLSDMAVRPYIDSWIDDIQAYDEWRRGAVTAQFVNDKYQEVLNAATKLDANRDLAEKMLHQGI